MTDPADPVPLAAPEPPRIELFMTVIRVAHWQTTVRWYIDTLGLAPLLLDAAHEFALLSPEAGASGCKGSRRPIWPRCGGACGWSSRSPTWTASIGA